MNLSSCVRLSYFFWLALLGRGVKSLAKNISDRQTQSFACGLRDLKETDHPFQTGPFTVNPPRPPPAPYCHQGAAVRVSEAHGSHARASQSRRKASHFICFDSFNLESFVGNSCLKDFVFFWSRCDNAANVCLTRGLWI